MSRAIPTPLGAAVGVLTELAAIEDDTVVRLGRGYSELVAASAATNDPAMMAVILAARAMLETTGRAAARRARLLDQLAELAGGGVGMIQPLG